MLQKLLAAFCILTLGLVTVAGCGNSDSAKENAGTEVKEKPSVQHLKDSLLGPQNGK
jgi:hypothetical protein